MNVYCIPPILRSGDFFVVRAQQWAPLIEDVIITPACFQKREI